MDDHQHDKAHPSHRRAPRPEGDTAALGDDGAADSEDTGLTAEDMTPDPRPPVLGPPVPREPEPGSPSSSSPVLPEHRFPSSNIGRPRIAGVEAAVAAGLSAPSAVLAPPSDALPHTAARHLAPKGEELFQTEQVPDEIAAGVELPDWTDPPTGEVPAVLRRPDAEARRVIPGPVWRESERDFDEDRQAFADIVSGSVPVVAHEESHGYDDGLEEIEVSDMAALDRPVLPATHDAPPGLSAAAGDMTQLYEPRPPSTYHGESVEEASGKKAGVRFAGRAARHAGTHAGSRSGANAGTEAGQASRDDPPRTDAPATHATSPTHAKHQKRRLLHHGERRESGHRAGRDIAVAIMTGLVFGAITLACCAAGPALLLALSCVALVLAAAELCRTLRHGRYEPASLVVLAAAPAAAAASYFEGPVAIPLVLALALVVTAIWYMVRAGTRSVLVSTSVTMLGLWWIAGLGAFAGLLLDPTAFPARHGVAYLLGAIEATVAYDVGGLAAGSLAGRRRLAPHVSPNKTWEGLCGGIVLEFAVALAITSRMHPWTLPHAALLGVVVAVLAPLGDLAESLVKRDLHVKDMGKLLPAHGGVLDRIDALLFVLPGAYLLVRSFHT